MTLSKRLNYIYNDFKKLIKWFPAILLLHSFQFYSSFYDCCFYNVYNPSKIFCFHPDHHFKSIP